MRGCRELLYQGVEQAFLSPTQVSPSPPPLRFSSSHAVCSMYPLQDQYKTSRFGLVGDLQSLPGPLAGKVQASLCLPLAIWNPGTKQAGPPSFLKLFIQHTEQHKKQDKRTCPSHSDFTHCHSLTEKAEERGWAQGGGSQGQPSPREQQQRRRHHHRGREEGGAAGVTPLSSFFQVPSQAMGVGSSLQTGLLSITSARSKFFIPARKLFFRHLP